jgi:hypothetical protein
MINSPSTNAVAPLICRIKGEYAEMPGLRLTMAQACRLWQIDPAVCATILDRLVHEKYLHLTRHGEYTALAES